MFLLATCKSEIYGQRSTVEFNAFCSPVRLHLGDRIQIAHPTRPRRQSRPEGATDRNQQVAVRREWLGQR